MFLEIKDVLVNLKNVSNINILNNKNRIIFNLNYSINIGKKTKSDYIYWDSSSREEFNNNLKLIENNVYFKQNFIPKINNGYININEISSIKFIEKKYRVIFNLNNPVTFSTDNTNLATNITSDFVYVNCYNLNGYKQYRKFVKNSLTNFKENKDGN